MAIVDIDKAPQNDRIYKLLRPLIITLSSGISNNNGFRYLLKVLVNDIEVVRFESQGNQADVAHFDLGRIAGSYTQAQEIDTNDASIHFTEELADAPEQFKKITVQPGYSDDNTAEFFGDNESIFWVSESIFNIYEDSFANPYQFYEMSSPSNNRFLSTQREVKTYPGDFGVIGFFNYKAGVGFDGYNASDRVKYIFYDANGVTLNQDFLFNLNFPKVDLTAGTINTTAIKYAPLHGENVRQFYTGANWSDVASYEIFLFNSGAQPGAIIISEVYKVTKVGLCQDRQYFQLGFINNLGAWEYHTFTGRNDRTIESNRKEFNKLTRYWNEAEFPDTDKGFAATGGRRSYSTKPSNQLTLNTDFLTEAESAQIYQLINSPYVVVFGPKLDGTPGTFAYNGVVTEKKIKIKRQRWDRLLQFTLKVDFKSFDF